MNNYIIYLNLVLPFIVKIFIPDGRYGSITIVTDTILLPIILIILNISVFLNKIEVSILKLAIFMLLGLLLGNVVGYIIWGISSKHLFNPDAETQWINKALILYHICLVAIFLSVVYIVIFLRNKLLK